MSSYHVTHTYPNGTNVEISVGYGTKVMKETVFIPMQPDNESFYDAIKAYTNELKIKKTVREAQKKLKRAEEQAARKEKLSSVKKLTREYVLSVKSNISAPTIQQEYNTAFNNYQIGLYTYDSLIQQYGMPDQQ